MKKVLVMILFLIPFAFAEHTLSYDNFNGVGENSNITLFEENEINETDLFLYNGSLNEMLSSTDKKLHSIIVTSDVEEDVPFTIIVYGENASTLNISTGDSKRESSILVEDQRLYGTYFFHNDSHIQDERHSATICPFIKRFTGSPTVRAFMLWNDSSNNREIEYSALKTVTAVAYESTCFIIDFLHSENLTANHSMYVGLQCTNCDGIDKLNLGVDTSAPLQNRSVLFTNYTSKPINQTNDYMIVGFTSEIEPFEEHTGTLRFRIPYYFNVTLYNTFNETLKTEFDYVYLQKINNTVDYSNIGSLGTTLGKTLDLTTKAMSLGQFSMYGQTIDDTEVFWGEVVDSSANIKLYETGNYTVTLLSLKTFINNGWNYEFIKPQYTSSAVETALDTHISFENKNNVSAKIYMSEYEANKKGFYFNIGKWLFALMLLIGGIIVSFYSPYPLRTLGGIVPIWLILIKLLGLI